MEVLLFGAVACMTALILSAWLMTFARWFPIKGLTGKFLITVPLSEHMSTMH